MVHAILRIILAAGLFFLPAQSLASGGTKAAGGLEAYRARGITASVSLTSIGTKTILSITEGGILGAVSCTVDSAPDANNVATLDINVDGQGVLTYSLYNLAATWSVTGVLPFTTWSAGGVAGDAIGDSFTIPFASRYATSIAVTVEVTTASLGTLRCAVARGTKI